MIGGPYFDGPGPWTRSTEGVHGPGVHVLYFPVKKFLLHSAAEFLCERKSSIF